MNLPDSFYIALCMTILLVGAVYWVWTQIQYVQRKVNVLENIVYELKTLCAKPEVSPYNSPTMEDLHETLRKEVAPYATVEEISRTPSPVPMSNLAPMPEDQVQEVQEVQDIPDFHGGAQEVQDIQEDVQDVQTMQTMHATEDLPDSAKPEPIYDMNHFVRQVETTEDDLQPGGVGSGIVVPSVSSSLDSMTLKELRRLAQQKGISGTEMRKKELIEAIRAVPVDTFLE